MWIVDDYGGNVMIPGYEGVPRKSVEILLTVRNGDFFHPLAYPRRNYIKEEQENFWNACYSLFFNSGLLALFVDRHRLSYFFVKGSCYVTEVFVSNLCVI